jgi:fucose 4-O-acetylase-like acetyltransferase
MDLPIRRDETVDIMKGLLILLMVAGHAQIPIHRFIYLFHMPVFFMITGWLYNYKREEIDIKKYTLKKISSLYIPYVKYGLFFLMLSIICPFFFKEMSGGFETWDIIKRLAGILLFQGRYEIVGTSWFLFALFFSSLIFNALNYFFDTKTVGGVIIILFLAAYYTGNKLYTGMVFSAALMIYLGYIIKNTVKGSDRLSVFLRFNLFILIGSFLLLILMLYISKTEIRMVSNQLVNPIYFILASVIGFIFVFQSAKVISQTFLKSFFKYLGKHSLVILFLHLLAFKLISYIQISVFNLDINLLSKHPVACKVDYWWILYMLAGLFLPLLFELFTDKIKTLLNHK